MLIKHSMVKFINKFGFSLKKNTQNVKHAKLGWTDFHMDGIKLN